MPAPIQNPGQVDLIARRLKALRESYGVDQVEFCQMVGLKPAAWNNYETGDRRISIDAAAQLKATLGVTLDWIYTGDASSLPLRLVENMRRAG